MEKKGIKPEGRYTDRQNNEILFTDGWRLFEQENSDMEDRKYLILKLIESEQNLDQFILLVRNENKKNTLKTVVKTIRKVPSLTENQSKHFNLTYNLEKIKEQFQLFFESFSFHEVKSDSSSQFDTPNDSPIYSPTPSESGFLKSSNSLDSFEGILNNEPKVLDPHETEMPMQLPQYKPDKHPTCRSLIHSMEAIFELEDTTYSTENKKLAALKFATATDQVMHRLVTNFITNAAAADKTFAKISKKLADSFDGTDVSNKQLLLKEFTTLKQGDLSNRDYFAKAIRILEAEVVTEEVLVMQVIQNLNNENVKQILLSKPSDEVEKLEKVFETIQGMVGKDEKKKKEEESEPMGVYAMRRLGVLG